MDGDMDIIRKVIHDIASDYTLSPKVAKELLERIISILRQYEKEDEEFE